MCEYPILGSLASLLMTDTGSGYVFISESGFLPSHVSDYMHYVFIIMDQYPILEQALTI